MIKNNNIPEIRFINYNDAWRKCRLGDILIEYVEKSKVENEYPLLSSTNAGMEKRNGRVSGTSNIGYKIIENGSLVFSPQNLWLGNININFIGKGIVSPSYKTYKLKDVNARFINPQVRLPKMMLAYKNASTQGASVVRRNLELSRFYEIEIKVPSKSEQEKIGSFFDNIEKLIAFNQQKYEKLIVIKKSILDKVFPKGNSKIPEIRFKGFSEEWDRYSIGECFTERRENMPDGELISVTIGEGIKKFSELGRYDSSNDDKSKYKKVCIGDIAYNSMRMWQGASGYSPYEGIVSPAYTVLSPVVELVDSKCMAYQFKRDDMIHTFQMNSQGITSDNWNLKYPTLSKIDVFVSPYIEEQQAIAEYLSNIDILINLYLKKLEKLVNIKKSMLDKMFV